MLKKRQGFTKRVARTRFHLKSKASGKPRLSVFRSNRYLYAQIIDDKAGTTLASASSLEGDLRAKFMGRANRESAREVGTLVAQRALKKGVDTVIFDRGGYKYHGCVKTLADAAREAGLNI